MAKEPSREVVEGAWEWCENLTLEIDAFMLILYVDLIWYTKLVMLRSGSLLSEHCVLGRGQQGFTRSLLIYPSQKSLRVQRFPIT